MLFSVFNERHFHRKILTTMWIFEGAPRPKPEHSVAIGDIPRLPNYTELLISTKSSYKHNKIMLTRMRLALPITCHMYSFDKYPAHFC